MYLKEIFNEENLDKEELFNVIVDKESIELIKFSAPPPNLNTLGLVLTLDEDNSIDTDLLDVIINYNSTNLSVILEVPSHLISKNFVKAKELIQLCSNLSINISILPPGHQIVDSVVTDEDYIKIISDLTDCIIEKNNFDRTVTPISNFMEYLMIEKILGENSSIIKNFKPNDPYIINNFSSILSLDTSNSFKNIIRNKLYDLYGGKENFDIVAETILQSIQNRSEEIYKQLVQDSINNFQHSAN